MNTRPHQQQPMATLLVSQPGIMRDSLHAMLKSVPGIEVIGVAGGGLSMQALLRAQEVHFVVVDANLPEDETLALLDCLREHFPRVCSVALTTTSRQDQKMLVAGAGAVLQRSCSAQAFTEVVRQARSS